MSRAHTMRVMPVDPADLRIVVYPDAALRRTGHEVDPTAAETIAVAHRMIELNYASSVSLLERLATEAGEAPVAPELVDGVVQRLLAASARIQGELNSLVRSFPH